MYSRQQYQTTNDGLGNGRRIWVYRDGTGTIIGGTDDALKPNSPEYRFVDFGLVNVTVAEWRLVRRICFGKEAERTTSIVNGDPRDNMRNWCEG